MTITYCQPSEISSGGFSFVGTAGLLHDPVREGTKRKSPSFTAFSQVEKPVPGS